MARHDTKQVNAAYSSGIKPDLCGELCVIDMSRVVAGNLTSQVLADLGARVIKIEKPGAGDSLRNWKRNGIETWWKVYGRGKESLALNLRSREGKRVLRQLIPYAHILIENFRPGTLEKMGLSPKRLLEINPDLVVLRISGWGQTGTFSHKPGFGTLIEAFSGFAAMNGFADRPPVLPPFSMADAFAGVFGAVGALAARRRVERTCQGEVIDLSLLEPLYSVLGPLALEASLTGENPPRLGSRSKASAPRNVYPTRDQRWIALSASTEEMARRLFDAIGKPELALDPRFQTNSARLQHAEELDEEISPFMESRKQSDLLEFFDRKGVTVGAVMDVLDFAKSEFVRDRGVMVAQPDSELGFIAAPHPPIRCEKAESKLLRPAPLLGEHTSALLKSLGYSDSQQHQLEQTGVIQRCQRASDETMQEG